MKIAMHAALLSLLMSVALFAGDKDEPRTGYFRTSVTPLELLGEQGAATSENGAGSSKKITSSGQGLLMAVIKSRSTSAC